MENSSQPISGKALWTGRIICGLLILFLLLDSIMKIIMHPEAVKGSLNLGWPEQAIQPIGIVLLISTILYAIPRTAIIGAILLTGYLGGAISIMVRVSEPYYFPLIFGILTWVGLGLINTKLRGVFSSKS
ncbi:MAG: DoxX family protein [Cyclobacteriaceae bacterium]|nr:DoxX family protein [Cyclobacteriaceae bacterium]